MNTTTRPPTDGLTCPCTRAPRPSVPVSRTTLQVYYHDDQRKLLVECVAPAIERVSRTSATTAHFTRHWRRGPHVRINIGSTAGHSTDLPDVVADDVRRWVSRHPSTTVLDPAASLATHALLREAERDFGELTPWIDNNTVLVTDYEDRSGILGSTEAADLLADFYVDTNHIALDMLRHATTRTQLLAVAFDMMIVTADRLSGVGLTVGYRSLRAHAEAFLRKTPNGVELRREWDSQYRRHANALARRLEVLGGSPKPGDEPANDRWCTVLMDYRCRAAALIKRGLIPLATEAVPFVERGPADPGQAAVGGLPNRTEVWGRLRPAPWFNVYRQILNYLYLHFTRVGITAVERVMLCHLLAQTVEECYPIPGIDEAMDRGAALQSRHDWGER